MTPTSRQKKTGGWIMKQVGRAEERVKVRAWVFTLGGYLGSPEGIKVGEKVVVGCAAWSGRL
jgi:hypothetical protein